MYVVYVNVLNGDLVGIVIGLYVWYCESWVYIVYDWFFLWLFGYCSWLVCNECEIVEFG